MLLPGAPPRAPPKAPRPPRGAAGRDRSESDRDGEPVTRAAPSGLGGCTAGRAGGALHSRRDSWEARGPPPFPSRRGTRLRAGFHFPSRRGTRLTAGLTGSPPRAIRGGTQTVVPEMLEFMLELKQHVTVRRTLLLLFPKLLLLLLLLLQRETDGKPKGEELIP